MSRLLGTNGSLKFKSTNTTLSNIEFYNAEDDFLGAFHFRKFANSNYPYFGGMTDANGQYFFQHKTNHSTLFRFDEVTRMAIFQDGRVAIGNVKKGSPMIQKVGGATDHSADDVSADEYKLIVETGILTEKVKVAGLTTDDWADYVFDEDYEMLSIDKLENYIKENKHLPNVPSAKEVAEKGLDLAKTDATLLEKIEESYLYIIELNKKFDDLASENNSLKSELKALKTVQD